MKRYLIAVGVAVGVWLAVFLAMIRDHTSETVSEPSFKCFLF